MKKGTFRMLIMGETGSGKTYYLHNELLADIADSFNAIIVFSGSHNEGPYKLAISEIIGHEGLKFLAFDDPDTRRYEILAAIKKIKEIQLANAKGIDKEGHNIYPVRTLFIFDDILDEVLFDSPAFVDIFTNFRHYNISCIVISQVVNKEINTRIKANTQYHVFFKLSNKFQQNYPVEILADVLDMDKREARRLYLDHVMQPDKHNHFIIGFGGVKKITT